MSGSDDSELTEAGEIRIGGERAGTILLPAWILKLSGIARSPRAWIVAVLVPTIGFLEAESRLEGGESAVEMIVEFYIIQNFLLPIFNVFFELGLTAVATASGVFDFLASIAPRAAVRFGGIILSLSGSIVNGVWQINLQLGAQLAPAGIAAPTIATLFAGLQIGGLVWALWTLAKTVDVPGLDVLGLVMAVTRPVRNFLGVFR